MNLRVQCLNFMWNETTKCGELLLWVPHNAPRDTWSCWRCAFTSLLKTHRGEGLYAFKAQNHSPHCHDASLLHVTIKLLNFGCHSLPSKTCFVRRFSVRRHVWTPCVSWKTCHCNTFPGLQKEFTNLCVQALDNYDSLAVWHEAEHVHLSVKTKKRVASLPSDRFALLLSEGSFSTSLFPTMFIARPSPVFFIVTHGTLL